MTAVDEVSTSWERDCRTWERERSAPLRVGGREGGEGRGGREGGREGGEGRGGEGGRRGEGRGGEGGREERGGEERGGEG